MLLTEFGLTTNDLEPAAHERFVKGAILRDLDNGKAPQRITQMDMFLLI